MAAVTSHATQQYLKIKKFITKTKPFTILGIVSETSLFSCAEPNANELQQRILFISIRFGAWEQRRLKRVLDTSFKIDYIVSNIQDNNKNYNINI